MAADGKRVHSESWMRAPDGTSLTVVSSQGDISALFADEHALYGPSRSPIAITSIDPIAVARIVYAVRGELRMRLSVDRRSSRVTSSIAKRLPSPIRKISRWWIPMRAV